MLPEHRPDSSLPGSLEIDGSSSKKLFAVHELQRTLLGGK
jgi:hypothetical protein